MTSPQRLDPPEALAWAVRLGWCLVGVALIWWAGVLVTSSDAHPWLAVVDAGATCLGLAIIVASWLSPSGSPHRVLGWVAVVASLGAFLVWAWIRIRTAPGYGTDEMAFDQYAAQLLVHGHNPYAHSMAPSFSLFHVSQYVTTFRLDGSAVTSLSYPSLSFLVYAPFLLVGWSTQLAPVVNAVAWALCVAVGYVLLPRALKPMAIVIGSLAVYTTYALGGVTDVVYVPLLMVAVYRWDRFPDLTGWRAWVAPVAMGFAMSVKQTPWLVLPFLALGLYLDADLRGDRRAGMQAAWRFIWRAAVAFFVLNLPFLVADPRAWIDGVLTPVVSHLVPEGQGWIALSTFLGIGGGSLTAFTFLLASALLCAFVLFVVAYPHTKTVMVLMPSLVLFFAARSLTNYFVMLIFPAIIAACSVHASSLRAPAWPTLLWGTLRRRVAVCGSVALVGIALVVATAWPQPIQIRIVSVATPGNIFTLNQITVMAGNRTGQVVHPVFFLENSGLTTAPWIIATGPESLAPGQTARYVIDAPNDDAQPSGYGGFQVVAMTSSPPAMSVSSPYNPTVWRVDLSPNAVDRPVPPGTPVTFTAQVVNQFDQPVRRAGIAVYLAQWTFEPPRSRPGLATINGQPGRAQQFVELPGYGAWIVRATTNAQGTARFVVVGSRDALTPVYFQVVLFNSHFGAFYGYSPDVTVVFSAERFGVMK